MRVAIVSQPWSHVIPPVEAPDSIAIWCYEVARRLAANVDMTIYSRETKGWKRAEVHEGVKYRRVPMFRDRLWRKVFRKLSAPLGVKSPDFRSRLYYRTYSGRMASEVQKGDYDLVHLHQFLQFAPVIRARAPRARIVLHMQAEWLSQLDKGFVQKHLRSVDGVLTCSAYLADKITDRFPHMVGRTFVVGNGIDIKALSPSEPTPQIERTGPPRVLFVGRVSPEKAVHDVIRAFTIVADQVPEAELHILGPEAVVPKEFIVGISDDPHVKALEPWYDGSGGYYERLKKMVPAALRARVHFVGAVERSALGEHYARGAVLVNPSVSETFGMTVIEAMVAGVPVVTTPVGGMQELVFHEKTGLRAEPSNPESVAKMVVRLLRDVNLRQSLVDAGRSMVLERYTWEKVAEQTLAAYRRIAP